MVVGWSFTATGAMVKIEDDESVYVNFPTYLYHFLSNEIEVK